MSCGAQHRQHSTERRHMHARTCCRRGESTRARQCSASAMSPSPSPRVSVTRADLVAMRAYEGMADGMLQHVLGERTVVARHSVVDVAPSLTSGG